MQPFRCLAFALSMLAWCLPAKAGLFIAKDVNMAMGFYTPEVRMAEFMHGFTPRLSAGVGLMDLRSDSRVVDKLAREAAYAQANWLVKRFHQPGSVANFYVFGGLGSARATPATGSVLSPFGAAKLMTHWGAQADFETRHVYLNANIHWYRSSEFIHRLETYQVGVTPIATEYEDWSPWLVLRAERRSGLTTGTEVFPVLRVFRPGWWFEVGRSTPRGHIDQCHGDVLERKTMSFRHWAAAAALFAASSLAWASPTAKINVDGMVCAFCAQGIEKNLKARAEVQRVFVSLENRLVAVAFKDGRSMSDQDLSKLIVDSGYKVTQIARVDESIDAIRASVRKK